jgi:hypothetical protein
VNRDRPLLGHLMSRLLGRALPLRASRRAASRGQSLVEFTLVAVVLFPFLFTLVMIMFNLAQTWSMNRAVDNMGKHIITTGQFNEGEFLADSSNLGFPADPTIDTLLITVTDSAGNQNTFTWGDGYSSAFTVHYGDLVSIEATKDLRIGEFAQIITDFLPDARVSWNGISQRNSLGEDVVPVPVPTTGDLTGTVRDADDGSPVSGAVIDLGGGHTATSAANGRYGIGGLAAGSYTGVASKTGYQDATSIINIASGVTTARDFTMESAAIIDVAVSLSSPANRVSNGDFETGDTSGWSSGVGQFTTPPANFDVSSVQYHSSSNAGVINVVNAVGGGVYQGLSGTFTAGRSYRASVWVYGESGATISVKVGAGGDFATSSTVGSGDWQQIIATWTPGTTTSSADIGINEAGAVGSPASRTFYLDDVEVVDTADSVNNAVVTTSTGLTGVSIGNGHYRLIVSPGPVNIEVNTSDGLSGSDSVSNAAAGTTTYVYITVN